MPSLRCFSVIEDVYFNHCGQIWDKKLFWGIFVVVVVVVAAGGGVVVVFWGGCYCLFVFWSIFG